MTRLEKGLKMQGKLKEGVGKQGWKRVVGARECKGVKSVRKGFYL